MEPPDEQGPLLKGKTMNEAGTANFYDRVRKALGKFDPDGDVSEEQLCATIALLVNQVNCLPTPNCNPVPAPTAGVKTV